MLNQFLKSFRHVHLTKSTPLIMFVNLIKRHVQNKFCTNLEAEFASHPNCMRVCHAAQLVQK